MIINTEIVDAYLNGENISAGRKAVRRAGACKSIGLQARRRGLFGRRQIYSDVGDGTSGNTC